MSCCGPMATGRVSILKEHRAPPASPRRAWAKAPLQRTHRPLDPALVQSKPLKETPLLRYRLVVLARFWRRRTRMTATDIEVEL
jgi:hypothetical protein